MIYHTLDFKLKRKGDFMSYANFYEDYGYPMRGTKLQKLKDFLHKEELSYEEGIEFTINLCDSRGEIVATGSLDKNILKCIAVSDAYQGEGLSSRIVTNLVSHGISKGYDHLFLFTKTENMNIFNDLGFYMISKTQHVALMENYMDGISDFVRTLKSTDINSSNVGAIILNCNPFTNGHLYLIETAVNQCDLLHLFVVSEDRSIFPAEVRFRLVEEGIKHLDNVLVHSTSEYLISSATFPTYFIKDQYKADEINCALDLTIFCDHFADTLGITKRFVGTEPFDKVTASYNQQMKEILGKRGVEVIEIPRYEIDGITVSASEVRRLLAQENYKLIRKLVPETTYNFLLSHKGKEIVMKLQTNMK